MASYLYSALVLALLLYANEGITVDLLDYELCQNSFDFLVGPNKTAFDYSATPLATPFKGPLGSSFGFTANTQHAYSVNVYGFTYPNILTTFFAAGGPAFTSTGGILLKGPYNNIPHVNHTYLQIDMLNLQKIVPPPSNPYLQLGEMRGKTSFQIHLSNDLGVLGPAVVRGVPSGGSNINLIHLSDIPNFYNFRYVGVNATPGDLYLNALLVDCLTPTNLPTAIPSTTPTKSPTTTPSQDPTVLPTAIPTLPPSLAPTTQPSFLPSQSPTEFPTTSTPSTTPTSFPSRVPSTPPSAIPSIVPTFTPTSSPTRSTQCLRFECAPIICLSNSTLYTAYALIYIIADKTDLTTFDEWAFEETFECGVCNARTIGIDFEVYHKTDNPRNFTTTCPAPSLPAPSGAPTASPEVQIQVKLTFEFHMPSVPTITNIEGNGNSAFEQIRNQLDTLIDNGLFTYFYQEFQFFSNLPKIGEYTKRPRYCGPYYEFSSAPTSYPVKAPATALSPQWQYPVSNAPLVPGTSYKPTVSTNAPQTQPPVSNAPLATGTSYKPTVSTRSPSLISQIAGESMQPSSPIVWPYALIGVAIGLLIIGAIFFLWRVTPNKRPILFGEAKQLDDDTDNPADIVTKPKSNLQVDVVPGASEVSPAVSPITAIINVGNLNDDFQYSSPTLANAPISISRKGSASNFQGVNPGSARKVLSPPRSAIRRNADYHSALPILPTSNGN